MENRDEILKALEASGMSRGEAEALLALSERMKGVMPKPQPQTYEDAVTALHDGIERSKRQGVPAANPVNPTTRTKAIQRLEALILNLAACGLYDLLVHKWAHLRNFFMDASSESDQRKRAGALYSNANRISSFGPDIAVIPWEDKRRLAKFAGGLIAHELQPLGQKAAPRRNSSEYSARVRCPIGCSVIH